MKLVKYEKNDLDGISYNLINAPALSQRENIKNFDQNNRCPNWDLNHALSEHKSRHTPLHQLT
jgi:hypothetical protein